MVKEILYLKKILGINKDLDIFYSSYNPVNVEKFKQKKLLAIAGIEILKIFLNY